MRMGFTLIEVMISLCILMICIIAFSRMQLVCMHARSYGECITRAVILGNSKLFVLRGKPLVSPELKGDWHQDQLNPINDGGRAFFRYWSVVDTTAGKDVTVYVAWSDKGGGREGDFTSLEELKSDPCPRIDLREFFFRP